MRLVLLAAALAVSTLATGAAFATPPAEPAPAPETTTPSHPPTPPNPLRTVRPSLVVPKAPTVDPKTAQQASALDAARANPAKPIPAYLKVGRTAKIEVAQRDERVQDTRTAIHREAQEIADKAEATAKTSVQPWNGRTVETKPSADQLGKAAALYVSAARVLVKKSGEFSARVARENPDEGAKVQAAKDMAADLRKGANLYRAGAEVEKRRSAALRLENRRNDVRDEGAEEDSADKAHNMEATAYALETRANAIEKSGVPGALPATITLK